MTDNSCPKPNCPVYIIVQTKAMKVKGDITNSQIRRKRKVEVLHCNRHFQIHLEILGLNQFMVKTCSCSFFRCTEYCICCGEE